MNINKVILLLFVSFGTLHVSYAQPNVKKKMQPKVVTSQQQNLTPKNNQKKIFLSLHDELLLKKQFKQIKLASINLNELYLLSHSQKTNIPVALGDGQQTWNMLIEEHEIRSADYKSEITTDSGRFIVPRDACGTFKGFVIADPSSWVRMNIREHSFSAIIYSNQKTFFLELINKFINGANENIVIIYTSEDVITTNAECGGGKLVDQFEKSKQQLQPKINKKIRNSKFGKASQSHTGHNHAINTLPLNTGDINSINNGPLPQLSANAIDCRKLEIATDSDYENYNNSASLKVTNQDILDNLNNVEGLYLGNYGISFRVRYQHEWATIADPYWITNVCNSNDRLAQFKDYWSNQINGFLDTKAYDLGVLYSGIDFDGTTVGCAYTSSIGNASPNHTTQAFCIIQTNTYPGGSASNWSSTSFTVLTGHEIGHIMGAGHVANSASIMAPSLSSNTNWDPISENQINSQLTTTVTQNRLSSRYIVEPYISSIFGSTFNGGEVYIRASVISFGVIGLPVTFEGVDKVEISGTSTITYTDLGGVTIKTAPCNHTTE